MADASISALDEPSKPANVELTYSRLGRAPHGGWRDFRGMAYVFAGAIVAAIVGVISFWLGVLIPFRYAILLFGLGQGVIVGLVLLAVFRRCKLGQKSVITPVSIATGLLSAALVYESLYLREAYLLQRTYLSVSKMDAIARLFTPGPRNPVVLLDRILRTETGHSGLIGYLIWRLRDSSAVSGAIGLHVLATVIGTFLVGRVHSSSAAQCPTCKRLMSGPKNLAVLPSAALGKLIDVVSSQDLAGAVALARQYGDAPLGTTCAIARQFTCGPCDRKFVDVVLFGRGAAAVGHPLREVSDEFATALRSEAVLPVAEPEKTPEPAMTEEKSE